MSERGRKYRWSNLAMAVAGFAWLFFDDGKSPDAVDYLLTLTGMVYGCLAGAGFVAQWKHREETRCSKPRR